MIGGYPQNTLEWICDRYSVSTIDELTKEQATKIIKAVSAKKEKVKKNQEAAEAKEAAEIAEEARLAFEG